MKTIFENVINTENYDLKDILAKINIHHIEGNISDEDREELIALARSKAWASNSIDILHKLEELDLRVKALEEGNTTDPKEEYPPYTVGKWYYNGDKCSENNVNYICIAPEGVVCVWSPSEYPAYWESAQ